MKFSRLLSAEVGILAFVGLFSALAFRVGPARTEEAERSGEPGEQIFRREGCIFCHSLPGFQPDPLPIRRGAEILQRWSTSWQRNGPDLSLEPARRTDDWHLAHLMEPASVLPGCPMRSHRNLSEADARDLIAYIQTPRGEGSSVFGAWADDQAQPQDLAASVVPAVPQTPESYREGKAIYQVYCQGCHGSEGNGAGSVGHLLSPEPRDFTSVRWMNKRSDEALLEVIRVGKPQTAMSGYGGVLSQAEQAQVLFYLRQFANPSMRMRWELILLLGQESTP